MAGLEVLDSMHCRCLPGTISTRFNHILSNLQVKQKSSRLSPKMVLWHKPVASWFKLYVDDSCRGNTGPCGGGRIIRDEYENLKIDFSKKFENGINNGAKLQALIRGIRLCKTMDIWHIIIGTLHW